MNIRKAVKEDLNRIMGIYAYARKFMSERGKVFGGIYDDRFLVKNTKSAKSMMPDADMELPYKGAKEMILVDEVENKEFLHILVDAMYQVMSEKTCTLATGIDSFVRCTPIEYYLQRESYIRILRMKL